MPIMVSRLRVLLVGLATTAASLTAPASAATWWWDTTTTGLWTDGANWSNNATSGGTTGTVPTNNTTTDNVVLNQSSVNGDTIVQLNADRSIRGIVIANTGSTTLQSDSATPRLLTLGADGIVVNAGAGAVTLGGGANPLNLAVAVSGSINNNSTSLVRVNSDISRTASDTSARRLNIGGTGNTLLNGVVSNGGASGALELFKIGTGTLTLAGANTFSGPANFSTSGNNGTVLIGVASVGSVGAITSSAFGTGTIALNGGGSVTIAGNDSVTTRTILNPIVAQSFFGGSLTFGDGVNNASIELAGGFTHFFTTGITNNLGGSGILTMSGPVNLVDNANRVLTIRGPGRTVIAGTISNAGSGYTGGLSLSGPGAVTLAAQNTYLGNTSLSGTATVRFGSSSIVQSGSIVSGPFGLGQVNLGGSGLVVTISGDDSATKRTVANRFNFDFGTYNYGDGVNDASLEFSGLMNSLYGGTQFTNNLASGTLTFSGTLSPGPNGGQTMTFAGNGRTEVTGVILNGTSASPTASNVTKNGNGTLVMTGQSVYTGQTSLNAGVLTLQAAENAGTSGPMGRGGTIVLSGGTLQYSSGNQFDYSSRFSSGNNQRYNVDTNGQSVTWASNLTSSGGTLTKLGSGTLTLTAANTYSGMTTISAGVLALSGSGVLATTGTVNPASGATFDISGITASSLTVGAISGSAGSAVALGSKTLVIGNATSTTFAATVAGAGNLTKQGSGAVTLAADNTYTGTTTINAGTLRIGAGSTAGALSASSAITGSAGATLAYNRSDAITVSNTIGGAINVTQAGAGTVILTSANTYTGTTTLSGGVINLGSAENPGVSGPLGRSAASSPGSIVMTGGTLQYSAANQNDYSGRLNASSTQYNVDTNGQSVTWATALVNTGATLTKLGSGTLTLGGTNTYRGTTVQAGVLATSGPNVISDSSPVTIASGATFRIGGSDTVAALSGAGTLDLNGNSLVSGLNTTSSTFSGSIIGTGTFGVNANTYEFTILGSNTFSGVADLRGGMIYVGNDSAFGTARMILGASTPALVLASADTSTRTFANNFGGSTTIFGTPTTGNLVFTGTMVAGSPIQTVTVNNSLTQFNLGWGDSSGSRIKSGTGTLAIGGSGVYTGQTNINAGTLQLGIGSTDGTLSTSSVITGSAGATFAVNRTNTATQGVDFRNGIGGGINVAQVGSGTLVLGGTNTYTGTTRLNAGALLVNSGSALAGGGSISFHGGTLMYSGSNQADYASRIVGSSAAISINTNGQNVSWSSPLANTNIGGLSKLGSGTLALLSASTYSGQTLVSSGVLALGVNGSFVNSETIVVGNAGSSGAVLDLTAKSGAFGLGSGQTLMGGGIVKLAADTVFTVSGTFSPGNSPGLFTYSSGTTVLAGTTLMEIYGTSRATSPSHGSGFYDAVNIVNNGTLQFGGNLTFEFSSLFDNNSTFDLFTPASGSFLAGNFTGVTVTGGFYSGLSWNQTGPVWKSSNTAGGQSLEFNSTNGQLVIVPEPATIALAGIGIGLAGWAAARKQRGAS